MPKLKKKSKDVMRKERKEIMSSKRQDESKSRILKEADRKSKEIRRQDPEKRRYDNLCAKICQKKRLLKEDNLLVHRERLKISQTKRLGDEESKLLHCRRLIECQKKRLYINDKKKIHLQRMKDSQKKRLSINEKKKIHLQRIKDSQKKRLGIEEKRKIHLQRMKDSQKKRLGIEEKKKIHLQRMKDSQKKRLSIDEKKKIHLQRIKDGQIKRLKDPSKKNIYLQQKKICQQKRLENPSIRNNHLQRLKVCQRNRLENASKKCIHLQRLKVCQRNRLENASKKCIHLQRLKVCQRNRLENASKKQIHLQRLKVCQRNRLDNASKKQIHLQRLIVCQKKRLEDSSKKYIHLQRIIENQKNRMKNIKLRIKHNSLNQLCQRKRLKNKKQIEMHRQRLKISQCKRMLRLRYRMKHNEKCRQSYYNSKHITENKLRTKIFTNYENAVRDGPYWECVSCSRLFFKSSVTFCTVDMFSNVTLDMLKQCCSKMVNDVVIGYMCSCCKKALTKNEKPRFSLCHKGLHFPDVPEVVKKLSPLEERFLCPRIPFMQIRTIGGNQQYSVKGRVVNVPTDVAENIDVLPRLPHETDVIPVVLKKKKVYKSNVMFQTVRPNIILDSLKALEHCPVFKKANVSVDYSKINSIRTIQEEYSEDNENDDEEIIDTESDSDSEIEPLNVPADHTLLNSEAIVFAPGENFQPIPLFMDTDAEAMSFIKIYGGEIKEYPSHMSYQDITKSEVMRSDKRVASSIDKLFYSCTFLRAQKISNSISICLRKSSGRQNATVQAVLSDDFVNSIVAHDSGYKIFAPDRGSPAFWELKKKELFAMIRQIGPPTFFITLSPAETKWAELLVILKKVIDGDEVSEEDALMLPYEEKVRLIKHDPVTCGVYFDYRLRKLFNVLKAKDSVFREYDLVDSYIRIEFQQRGSPHAHCLVWLEGAPKLNPEDLESVKQCENFIDRFVSCKHDHDNVRNELIQFQIHKHTFTCWKKKDKNEKKCRFGIPSFPMKQTKILEPLGDSVTEVQLKQYKTDFTKIRTLLDQLYHNEQDLTFDAFLNQLGLSEEEYLLAIRSSLKRPKCFLQRSLKDIKVNAYNPEILSLHRSNMDIQFITDVYSCAMYVLNYINKSTSGMSKILRDAKKEVSKGDFTLKEKMRFLANKFLNASEFSAQEAVYYVLSLPLSMCSRSTIFINTSVPEKRVSILKNKRELQLLPDNSTDIFKKSVIDHYCERPEMLNDICLAEYASYYTCPSSKKSNCEQFENEINEEISDERELHENEPRFPNNVLTKRKRAKILRYVRFNVETDEANYYREQLMLFSPWRNEVVDLINVNHKMKFLNLKDVILTNRAKFIHGDSGDDVPIDIIDIAVNDNNINEENNEEDNHENDEILPNEYEVLNDRNNDADIFTDIGINGNKKTADEISFPVPHMVDDDSYNKMVRSLNENQRKYMLHVLNCHKLNIQPVYECVLGGAGVGKSRLIDTIHQTLLRHYNKQSETDLESVKVLICAPTGKAAFNIKGVTLHSAFVLPLNQFASDMPPLSSSISNSILSKLRDLKLIIIDEISMVGSKVFGQINLRLQQIFRSSEPFAGKSITVFGDFNQLAPVGDRYIFKPDPSNPYSELIGNPLWEKFTFFTLNEIMRQKDDATFAIALNNLAEGTLTDSETEMINSRVNCPEPPDTIRLFRSNAEVDKFNESVLRKQKDVTIVNACDKVIGKVHETLKKSLLNAIKELKVSSTYGLPKLLKLSIGIHYMLTNNIKVDDGLVNGAVGILKYIEKNDAGNVKRVWMSFTDPNVGKVTRNDFKRISQAKNIDQSLTPIEMVSKNVKPRQNTLAMVMRRQFPLVPAEAITIYKSQGGTYTSAVVNLKPGMKRNEIYVALSRVTSLSGLYIKGTFVKPHKTNDEVSRVIKKCTLEKPVKMKLLFLDKQMSDFTIVFHNIQSLRKHHGDLIADHFLTCADIIALVETWTIDTDDIDISGYKIVHRVDVKKTYRHAYGIIVYCKAELENHCKILFEHNCEENQKSCNLVVLKVQDSCICVTYKPPSTLFRKVKPLINSMIDVALGNSEQVIVLGDFNINLLDKNSKAFDTFLSSKGLTSKIKKQPSTDGMTQIDICYSNIDSFSASYFESYFSYHKPIIGVLSKEKDTVPTESDVIISDINPHSHEYSGTATNENESTINKAVTKTTRNAINVVGFKNVDGVSCYANAVCQCIFFISALRDTVIAQQNDVMMNLYELYLNPTTNLLSSLTVRQMVDNINDIEHFTLPQQQDVPEFIAYLINCLPELEKIVKHELIIEYKCLNCSHNYKDDNVNTNLILPIYTSHNTNSLNELFKTSYGNWENITKTCGMCSSNNSITKSTISLTEQCSVMFVQLMIFEIKEGNWVKNLKTLTNLHSEIVKIDDANFKISGIIDHHGPNITSGHYTCKLRSGNTWYQADDNKVTKCNKPEVETNTYVIVLEKC